MRRDSGFTLLEVMIAVLVLGLAGAATVSYTHLTLPTKA